MLDAAGFDTLASLALPISEFREEVTGMKAGHARALNNMVAEERARLSKPHKLDFIEQPPVPESTRDNSMEKRALAGKFPKFPSNEEKDQRKVMSWFVGVASWSRIWSLDIANACEGTAMKSGLGTSQKSLFIISPCYPVQQCGYNEPKKDII